MEKLEEKIDQLLKKIEKLEKSKDTYIHNNEVMMEKIERIEYTIKNCVMKECPSCDNKELPIKKTREGYYEDKTVIECSFCDYTYEECIDPCPSCSCEIEPIKEVLTSGRFSPRQIAIKCGHCNYVYKYTHCDWN